MARLAVAVLLLVLAAAPAASARPDQFPASPEVLAPEAAAPAAPVIAWRESTPVGRWWAGRLRRGVQLPAEGPDWFTWDPVLKVSPNRDWRLWGTDRLVRTTLDVITAYRLAHPEAPRVGIGDLSRRHGGDFGARFGGLGHASHQIGLDVDIYYPRVDGRERRPFKPSLVDLELAQDLVDRFVAAGARAVYVGPSLGLTGPRRIVSPLVHHDDHLHVRLPLTPSAG
jgi:penicillin-insensitive murein endopeptidase